MRVKVLTVTSSYLKVSDFVNQIYSLGYKQEHLYNLLVVKIFMHFIKRSHQAVLWNKKAHTKRFSVGCICWRISLSLLQLITVDTERMDVPKIYIGALKDQEKMHCIVFILFFTQNLITDFLASWCYRLRLIKLFTCVSRKFICLLTIMNNCWMILHASECVGSQNYHLFLLLQKVCFIMFIFVKIINS